MRMHIPVLLGTAQAPGTPNHRQQPLVSPCGLLAATFPTHVFQSGDANYTSSQEKYWSAQQAELTPACRFYPENAIQIQIALADIVLPNRLQIAVASGGHSSVEGASNIAHGITFDLSRLTDVNFFLDAGKAVYLGPGARWQDVYSILEDSNLTVAGGRAANVGVGGHVLGGGLSWYSNEYGWASDNVVEFEVVTPQAEILLVRPGRYGDLFWALKGSLGAFGIVTKIKMKTIEHNGVYGGALGYDQAYLPQLCHALANLTIDSENDPTTQGYISFAWTEEKKRFGYAAYLMNTAGHAESVPMSKFKAIPHVHSSLRSMSIGESAKEIDESNPAGRRRSKFTLTGKMNAHVMLALHDLIQRFTSNVKFDKDGVLGVTFQPIPIPHLQHQDSIFNVGCVYSPLLLVSVEIWWGDKTQDVYFDKTAKDLRQSMEQELKKLKAFHEFIYANYAAKDQDPFASFSDLNKRKLSATINKYDPDGLWRKTVPGIWHV